MRLGVRQDPFVKFSVQSDTRDFLTTNMVKTAPRINAGSNAEWRSVPYHNIQCLCKYTIYKKRGKDGGREGGIERYARCHNTYMKDRMYLKYIGKEGKTDG